MLVLEEDLDQKIQLSYTLAPIFTFPFSKYADGKHENPRTSIQLFQIFGKQQI